MQAVVVMDPDAEDRADRIRVYRPVIKLMMVLVFGIPFTAYGLLQLRDDAMLLLLPVCGSLFLFTLTLLAILVLRSGPEDVKPLDRVFGSVFFVFPMFTGLFALLVFWVWPALDEEYVVSVEIEVLVRMIVPAVLCFVVAVGFRTHFRWVRWLVAMFVLWTCVGTHFWFVAPSQPQSPPAVAQTTAAQKLQIMTDTLRQGSARRVVEVDQVELFHVFSFSSPFWRPELRDFPHFAFCVLTLVYAFFIRRRLLAKAERAG